MKSATYFVSGTHCRSCELLIEKTISSQPGVKSVVVSLNQDTVTITAKKPPSTSKLNTLFSGSSYHFSVSPLAVRNSLVTSPNIFISFFIAIVLIGSLYSLHRTSLFSFSVNTDSLYPAFFVFGLLAGLSTCATLVGGIILSLTRQWQSLYTTSDSLVTRLQPVIFFNFGRIAFFTFFGAVLGYFGSFFRLSLSTGAVITILVSIFMFFLGVQMTNPLWLRQFNFSLPKFITSRITNEKLFSSRHLTFLMGGLTFFLPCGFTLTAQSLALASSSPVSGGLTLLFFALGTTVPLGIIGLTGAASHQKPMFSAYFSQVAGVLIVIFSLYNFYSQSIVLGIVPAFSRSSTAVQGQSSQITKGVQVIKMTATASGYTPNYFKINAGQKIRWEIFDQGSSGCTNAIIARSFFSEPINLVPGTVSIREFVAPSTPGKYRFSCWMGMISGTIEVI